MRRVLLLLSALGMALAQQQTIRLEPAGPTKFDPGGEHDATTAKDNLVGGKTVVRLTNISIPTLTFYPAPANHNTGAAVIVFPGGGYRILALDLEGSEICEWFNSIGVNAALVKYRVPAAPGAARHEAPLIDARNALTLMRGHAADWHIDANRVGVIGFSAGGEN